MGSNDKGHRVVTDDTLYLEGSFLAGLGAISMGQKEELEEFHDHSQNLCQVVEGMESNHHVGVPKTRGTPKWMVYNGNPY